jgi:hypothetical protein
LILTKNALLHTNEQSSDYQRELGNWEVARFGHASKGQGDTRINNEIRKSLSRKRITVSLEYQSPKEQVKKSLA